MDPSRSEGFGGGSAARVGREDLVDYDDDDDDGGGGREGATTAGSRARESQYWTCREHAFNAYSCGR